jgi:hypothetical protein
MAKVSAGRVCLSEISGRQSSEKGTAMRRPKLVVKSSFEAGRLGTQSLIDAYAQLVPVYKRRAKVGDAAVKARPKDVAYFCRRTNR